MKSDLGPWLFALLVGCGGNTPPSETPKGSDPPASDAGVATTTTTPWGEGNKPEGVGSLGCLGPCPDAAPAAVPPSASIQRGQPVVSGPLPPDVIDRVLMQNAGRVRICYEDALKAEPTLKGTVKVTFTIDTAGKTKGAKDDGSAFKNATVVSCIVDMVGQVSFPKPEGKEAKATVTWTLAPGN